MGNPSGKQEIRNIEASWLSSFITREGRIGRVEIPPPPCFLIFPHHHQTKRIFQRLPLIKQIENKHCCQLLLPNSVFKQKLYQRKWGTSKKRVAGFLKLQFHDRTSSSWLRQKPKRLLIHSTAPQSRPVVIIVFTLVVCLTVSPSPTFQNLAKQNSFQVKTGEIVGLAEWITDDTCLVFLFFQTTALILVLSLFTSKPSFGNTTAKML